jgi:malonyl-CoA/methylmalonyl-CoA synthetase
MINTPSPSDPIAWIEHAAQMMPLKPWLFDDRGAEDYAGLVNAVRTMAGRLTALGVAPGDRVAVQVEKSRDALHLYLGCLWLGAVYLPLNNGYTIAEIDYFLSDAAPSLFVVDPASEHVNRPTPRIVTLGANGTGRLMDVEPSPVGPRTHFPANQLAAMLYTSGTTGRPKGAMLSRGNLASCAATLVEAWHFSDADTLIHALPIFHVHGLFVATNTVLAAGASLRLISKFEPQAVTALFERSTVLMGVPTFYTRLLTHDGLRLDTMGTMRLFVSGSAPLLAETHRAFEARTGHAILERYGMTETMMNTSNPYEGPRVPGTVGPPLPGVSVRVTEPDTGAPLPSGEIGMVEVKGPNVFMGYWNMPEKTAAEFRADGFFITGDLGMIDEAGYLHIVGRGKDLIISGGLNIYPKEVEEAIDAIPGVNESAVIGLADPDFGEAVVAVVAAAPGAVDENAIRSGLADKLARFKQPKAIVIVTELPRNTMGKVQKAALRERFAGVLG